MSYKTFVLKNKNGMTLKVSNLGGIVMGLTAPDRNGVFEDVLLGFDDPSMCHTNGYMSALIGRVANRIGRGTFQLDGKTYEIALNSEKDGVKCSLHGGTKGFDQKVWDARTLETPEGPAVELCYLSPDGEEGFPGNLFVRVVYTMMECNAWRIQYWAMTDASTVVNLTHHAYFNLNGGKYDVLDHLVQILCDQYTPSDKALVTTGKALPVVGTPLDFTEATRIGERLDSQSKVITLAGGYDHNYLINRTTPGMALCAVVEDQESGRQMETWTTEPCVQFYTANFLADGTRGKGGAKYGPRHGFCLETQHAPDAPNKPGFESIRLNPGQVMQSTTIYQFYAV